MFLRIIIAILIVSVAIEFFIFRKLLAQQSKNTKIAYYTLTALCVVPYAIIFLISLLFDISDTFLSDLSPITLILFLINILWKTPLSVSLLLCHRPHLHWTKRGAVVFSAIATLIILYGALWERHQLRTTHLTLHYENLPEGADGLRIVQISDIHIGNKESRYKFLERVVEEVMHQRADIILDCGDMVNAKHTELDSTTMAILSRITAPLGVYTVLGNHDQGGYIRDTVALPMAEHRAKLLEKQAEMGWRNITDSTVVIPVGNDALYLTAIEYPTTMEVGDHGSMPTEDYSHHFAHIPENGFNIVLAHTPAMWDNIKAATEAELTLSGHVHAMQLRIPIGPRGWSPAALVYEQWSGLYEEGNNRLYVSDGIGGGVPIRVGTKPQIVVITLKKK